MQGKATVWGHPIHPMLIPFPIAFFGGSLVADILYFLTDAELWTTMGTVLIGFGIVSALLAAVVGVVDYLTAPMPPRVKNTATRHMLVNVAVVALYTVNFFVRRQTPEAALGYVLSIVGIGGLLIAGWLGGALVYEHHVGAVRKEPASVPTAPAQRGREQEAVQR